MGRIIPLILFLGLMGDFLGWGNMVGSEDGRKGVGVIKCCIEMFNSNQIELLE